MIPKMMLFIDTDKCTGCRTCEIMCAIAKGKVINPKKSRIKVIDKYPMLNYPIVCNQCAKSPCLDVCPAGAIRKDEKTNIVLVDAKKCTGCGLCVEACEIGAIYVDLEKGTAMKCDYCMGNPVCVKYCEPKAIRYIRREKVIYGKGERGPELEVT